MTVGRREKVMAVKERARTLDRRVRELEEENRALRVAIGLDAAHIEEGGTARRIFQGKARDMRVGCLEFPIPKGWEFDKGQIMWQSRNGQAYLKVPIIKTEV